MAITSNTYTGNGSNKLFSITFPYLDTTDIDVYLNGVLQTVTTQYSFANATTIEFVTAPSNGAVVLLNRSTDDTNLQATFFPGSSIKAADLNYNFDQVLYLAQETAVIAQNQSTAGLQAQITAANNTAANAVVTANTANATANAADTTANGIAGTAASAVTTANSAVTTANSAVTTANNAVTTANNAASTVASGFRNRIINGDMIFNQRFTGTNPIFGVGSAYILDRWIGYTTIAGNMRISQSTDAPAGFRTSQKVEAVTGATIGAADYFLTAQKIEGYNVYDFNFGTANAVTVTLSFWVKCSVTGTHSGVVRNASVGASYRAYPFTYSISAANTWEKKSIVIPGDTTGTWDRAGGTGMEIVFDHGAGTTLRGTAGAYTSSSVLGVTGSAAPLATVGATWLITGVQLEQGTVATPYEHTNIASTVIILQRYYFALSAADTLPVTTFTDQARGFFKFPVSMRVVPTCTFTYDIGGGATWAIGASGGYQATANSNVSGFGVRADAEL